MAKALEGYTDTVVVSFLDIFDKVAQNFLKALDQVLMYNITSL